MRRRNWSWKLILIVDPNQKSGNLQDFKIEEDFKNLNPFSLKVFSYCPLDWRMIAIQEKHSVTLLTIESFGNNSTVMLVRNTITIADLEGKEPDQISKRTEKIWSNSVDELILNCESSGDHLLGFTSIIWRKKQLLASRSCGDIFSLPDGELGWLSH